MQHSEQWDNISYSPTIQIIIFISTQCCELNWPVACTVTLVSLGGPCSSNPPKSWNYNPRWAPTTKHLKWVLLPSGDTFFKAVRCSHEALKRYFLSVWRIVQCQPCLSCPGLFSPVIHAFHSSPLLGLTPSSSLLAWIVIKPSSWSSSCSAHTCLLLSSPR